MRAAPVYGQDPVTITYARLALCQRGGWSPSARVVKHQVERTVLLLRRRQLLS